LKIKKNKLQYHGLEIFYNTPQVIPPTATECKHTQQFHSRKWLNEEDPILELYDSDTKIIEWIKDIILKTGVFDAEMKTNTIQNESVKYNKDIGIVDLINIKYIDEYPSWLSIMWAMKKEGYTEEKAKEISMKSSKYDDNGFDKIWSKDVDYINLTHGTLNYYAKLSNPEKYSDIIKNQIEEVMNILS